VKTFYHAVDTSSGCIDRLLLAVSSEDAGARADPTANPLTSQVLI